MRRRPLAATPNATLLQREDCTLVAWYPPVTHLTREGRMTVTIGRRELLAALGGAAAWPLAARAQQRTMVPQIGILDPGLPQHFEAFRRGMDDLGYVEGRSVSYMYRTAAGRAESVPRLASELVALKPDAIVTASALPVRAVKEATSTIPIVFATLADAITAGAVNNLAHPGANVTGFSFLNTELSAKRLELLVEALPNIRRVAVLRDLNTPREWAEATEETGHRLGLALQLLEVAEPGTYEDAFEAAVTARADALDILASAFFNSHKVSRVGGKVPAADDV